MKAAHPPASPQTVLSVLVQNQPGVLARIAGMFSRRGYNIESLAVGHTDDPEVSRMTISVGSEATQIEQITKQLNKLVHVLKVVEFAPGEAVASELMLVKVRTETGSRSELLDLIRVWDVDVVDMEPSSMTMRVVAPPGEMDRIEDVLHDYGIIELARTGAIALSRGGSGIADSVRRLRSVV